MRKSFVLIRMALMCMAVALVAGCGSGSSAKLSSNDVAVVGKTHIPKAQLDELLARAEKTAKAQNQKFPAQGTTQYQALRNQAVTSLVEQAEFEQKAAAMGVTVTKAEIDKRLAFVKKQYYGGSEKRYLADITKRGYTDAQVRNEVIRLQLLSEKVQKQIIKNVKVSNADVDAYYKSHITSYSTPPTRSVRYILVGKSKAEAESVYQQLKNGNAQTWCKLAKKYAKDASAQTCGKTTFTKGQTVKVFDQAAFDTPTGTIVQPFYDPTQYKAWFVAQPVSDVKPAVTTPEKQVAAAIRQTLLSQKQQQAVSDWSKSLTKSYCSGSKIRYQVGYAANPDPCAATTSALTTG